MSSSHNVRENIAETDPGILSDVNGGDLAERGIYGAHFILLATTSGQTRKLAPPSAVGQKVSMSGRLTSGTLTVSAPAGTTFDGTNATLTFTEATGNLWITLESFDVGGVLMWRSISRGAGVTLTA
jgi:hypothetical protein